MTIPIPGHETRYWAHSSGRILSLPKKTRKGVRVLKSYNDPDGYLRLSLNLGASKSQGFGVHRLIAESFIPNPDKKPAVNHIDGDKTNNRPENLEWVTNQENTIHAVKIGLQKGVRGERNNLSKLTESQVIAIRADNRPAKEIAKDYPVTSCAINIIKRNEAWVGLNEYTYERAGTKRNLSDEQVRDIRKDERKDTVIGREYGYSSQSICSIKHRKSYAHVTD